jgi:acyl carrier protein
MIDRAAVFGVISEILSTELGREEPLGPETELLSDAALDSIELLTLTVEIENRFEIVLDDVDPVSDLRIGDLVGHVLRHLESKPARPGPVYESVGRGGEP